MLEHMADTWMRIAADYAAAAARLGFKSGCKLRETIGRSAVKRPHSWTTGHSETNRFGLGLTDATANVMVE